MSECNCQRKHPDPESRAWIEEELKTARGQRSIALVRMLEPCPEEEE